MGSSHLEGVTFTSNIHENTYDVKKKIITHYICDSILVMINLLTLNIFSNSVVLPTYLIMLIAWRSGGHPAYEITSKVTYD